MYETSDTIERKARYLTVPIVCMLNTIHSIICEAWRCRLTQTRTPLQLLAEYMRITYTCIHGYMYNPWIVGNILIKSMASDAQSAMHQCSAMHG